MKKKRPFQDLEVPSLSHHVHFGKIEWSLERRRAKEILRLVKAFANAKLAKTVSCWAVLQCYKQQVT